MAMLSIPGYLLVSAGPSIAVLNTTLAAGGRGRPAPRPVSRDDFASLAARFMRQQPEEGGAGAEGALTSTATATAGRLLAAEPARGLVVLGFGHGVAAVYEMDLPFRRRPGPHKALSWLQVGGGLAVNRPPACIGCVLCPAGVPCMRWHCEIIS